MTCTACESCQDLHHTDRGAPGLVWFQCSFRWVAHTTSDHSSYILGGCHMYTAGVLLHVILTISCWVREKNTNITIAYYTYQISLNIQDQPIDYTCSVHDSPYYKGYSCCLLYTYINKGLNQLPVDACGQILSQVLNMQPSWTCGWFLSMVIILMQFPTGWTSTLISSFRTARGLNPLGTDAQCVVKWITLCINTETAIPCDQFNGK